MVAREGRREWRGRRVMDEGTAEGDGVSFWGNENAPEYLWNRKK